MPPWESWVNRDRWIRAATRCRWLAVVYVLCCSTVVLGPAAVSNAGELTTLTEENFDALAPRGDEAEAILGDYVLQNDRIILVIDNPELPVGSASNRRLAMRTCGAIIDMGPRAPSDVIGKPRWAFPDRLGWYFTGALWPSRDYTRAFKPQKGKSLSLEFYSWYIDQPAIRVKYTLDDGQPFVRCETIYLNPAPASKPVHPESNAKAAGDKFAEAVADPAPGIVSMTQKAEKPPAPLYPSPTFDLCVDGVVEHGVDAAQGLTWQFDAWNGQAFGVLEEKTWTHRLADGKERAIDHKTQIALARDEELHAIRRVFVAADLFQLRRDVDAFLAAKTRSVKLRVVAPDGEVAGALVTARRVMADHSMAELYGCGRSDAHGAIEFTLPDGEFDLRIEAIGRATQSFRVKSDGVVDAAVQTTSPAQLTLDVTDDSGAAIPCKVELRGRDGTPDPYFFAETGDRLVRNLLYLADGKGTQAVAPGKYDVIITRGPEYDAATQTVELAVGAPTAANVVHAKLVRSVDTTGWISAELSGQSTLSNHPISRPPAIGSALGRVLNLLCEGIEFAPPFEYCRITSYQPFIEQLGAKRFLASCPGVDLADGNRSQFGFPVVYEHPHWLDGGALQMPGGHFGPMEWLRHWGAPVGNPQTPDIAAGTPGTEKCIILSQPRNLPVKPTDEIRSPHSAFRDFDLQARGEPMGRYYLMRDTDDDGVLDRVNYSLALQMDALDVHRLDGLVGVTPRVPNDVIDWLLMRANGYRMPGVVGSMAIDNFHGAGGVRTYVRSTTDAPDKLDALSIAREIRAGHAVMTTGPFLEATVTTEEKAMGIPGDLVTTKSGTASLHLRVQCPNWISIDRVECWVNGHVEPAMSFDRAKTPARFGDGHVQFDQTLVLATRSDMQVVAIAYGHGPNYRRRNGSADEVARHVAVTNPILIDVGGDGFEPMNPVDEAIRVEPTLIHPVFSKKESPPGRLRLTIYNYGKATAEGTARLELRPAGVITVEGKSEIPFKLGAGEQVEVEVKLRIGGDAEMEALMGAVEQKKMTATLYVLRSSSRPGIAPSRLPIAVDDAAKMLDANDPR